jgi:hypothetical protein
MPVTTTLPACNDPTCPPDTTDFVAIWHATYGMIRGWYHNGGWYAQANSHQDATGGWIHPHKVLGWWPEPRPRPRFAIACARPGCGATATMGMVPLAIGDDRPVPDHATVPAGWTETWGPVEFDWVYLCPAHGREGP